MSALHRYLPPASWLRHYRRADLGADARAGLTTAVMLVPQAMGYALLAGLPPIHGLYAAVAPILLYAMLGTSRHLAVGPVAMDSILVASAVGAIATVGVEQYVLTAAAAVATVALILADNCPAILDPSVRPLQPVLRSNFWLVTHVMTITLSYAALALAQQPMRSLDPQTQLLVGLTFFHHREFARAIPYLVGSLESSAEATRRSARTVSTGSSISSAISRSVGVRPSFCVSIVSVRESFTRLEFWFSGMRTDRVCSASACSTV